MSDRGRAFEEEYFRKRDRELLAKMRQASAAEDARRELSATSELQDPKLLSELEAQGFTPETMPLLFFAPLVEIAWAEGGVSEAERTVIVRLARARGIQQGSAADRRLEEWLASRPAPEVLTGAHRLIRAILDNAGTATATMNAEELVKHCEEIAEVRRPVRPPARLFGRASPARHTGARSRPQAVVVARFGPDVGAIAQRHAAPTCARACWCRRTVPD